MNTLTIKIHTLPPAKRREIIKVHSMLGGLGTVGQVRSILLTGRFMTIFYTIFVMAIFLVLGLVFLPFMVIAPFCLIAVPMKIASDNREWSVILPADRSDSVVVLD